MKKINFIFKISLFILLAAFILSVQTLAKGDAIETISPRQAADLISKQNGDPNFVILDIRTPKEFKTLLVINVSFDILLLNRIRHLKMMLIIRYLIRQYLPIFIRFNHIKIR